MSSEKTAEMFKDKSEEEIMNWMIRNMTPEQIKSCFDDEFPEEVKVDEPDKVDVNDLRKFCSNKRYVIHKIEGDKVYFWYYLIKKQTWEYSIEPLKNFPQTMGQISDECGPDTNISDDFKNELIEAYLENYTGSNDRFEENNPDEDQQDIFNRIKGDYEKEGINEDWMDTLLTAIQLQKSIPVLSDEKIMFNFAPVLIESVSGNKVNYYYLKNNDGELEFIEANLTIDKFGQDLKEIIQDLNLQIILDISHAASATAKLPDEWEDMIKEQASKIFPADLDRIKEIYTKFPLAPDCKFFMKNLFPESQFGTNFGTNFGNNYGQCNKNNLNKYVENNFGKYTAEYYKPTIMRNKYGTTTIGLKR